MEQGDLGHHISQQFDAELEDVRNRVLAMGGLVEQQIIQAITSLAEGDTKLAEEVIDNCIKEITSVGIVKKINYSIHGKPLPSFIYKRNKNNSILKGKDDERLRVTWQNRIQTNPTGNVTP